MAHFFSELKRCLLVALLCTALFGCPVATPELSAVSFKCQTSADCSGGQTCQAGYCAMATIDAMTIADALVVDGTAIDRVATDTIGTELAGGDRSVYDAAAADRIADVGAIDHAIADVASVDWSAPDASHPDTRQPDASQPDTRQLDTSQPDVSQPDVSQPDTRQPDASRPDASRPDATLPCPGQRPLASCDPGDNTLVACYSFDSDVAGANGVRDSSQYGNHGTGTNAGHISHGSGQALSLAGDGYVSVADSVSLDVTSAITIEAWLYSDSIPSSGSRRGIVDNNGQYGLFMHDDGLFHCGVGTWVVGGSVAVGRWSHVVCTIDGQYMRIYVDGTLAIEQVSNAYFSTSPTDGMLIGANSPTGNDNFLGAFDDLKIYNRMLGADEICWAAQP